jgi:hypothetical protein
MPVKPGPAPGKIKKPNLPKISTTLITPRTIGGGLGNVGGLGAASAMPGPPKGVDRPWELVGPNGPLGVAPPAAGTPATIPGADPIPPYLLGQYDVAVKGLQGQRDTANLGIYNDLGVASRNYGLAFGQTDLSVHDPAYDNLHGQDANGKSLNPATMAYKHYDNTPTNGLTDIDMLDPASPTYRPTALNLSDPRSKMALLTQAYQHQKAGNQTSYASMGQINSGSYARQVASTHDRGNLSLDNNVKEFQGLVRGADSGTVANNTGYVNALAAPFQSILGEAVATYLAKGGKL